ncbi:MAG TPA: hypothetical protein VE291_01600 [Terracidiphilus sp.]|nr:hypothetical protein [Terracidiphilus sp.]
MLFLPAILYCAVQWKYTATMGASTIFSSSRRMERADFADMLNELSNATQTACRANPLTRLFFEDGDKALPYMKLSGDRLGGCSTVRNTNVTPFTKVEMEDCNVTFIREHIPPDTAELHMDNTLHTRPWIEVDRWFSSDGQYGFALYRHACLADNGRDVTHDE